MGGAGGHLAMAGVALSHHGGWLEGGVGDLSHGQLLVVGLLCGDDRGVRGEHEVDAGVGHQVSLELGHIHIQGAVKAQGGGQRRDDLGNQPVQQRKQYLLFIFFSVAKVDTGTFRLPEMQAQRFRHLRLSQEAHYSVRCCVKLSGRRSRPVQVGVCGALNVQGAAADVINGLIVEHDSHISVLQQGVGGQHGVVGLDNSCGHLIRICKQMSAWCMPLSMRACTRCAIGA